MAPMIRFMKRRYPAFYRTETDICIEGFPRSGNSFFTHVFQRWNPEVSVAHHTHLAASPKMAVSNETPALILIRHPIEAVASVVAWDGYLSPNLGLWSYQLYYNTLWRFRSGFIVVPFEEATSDPGACISRVNSRYGTSYYHSALNPSDMDTIRDEIASADNDLGRSGTNATLPNDEKTSTKFRYREQLAASRHLDAALAAYDNFMSLTEPGLKQ